MTVKKKDLERKESQDSKASSSRTDHRSCRDHILNPLRVRKCKKLLFTEINNLPKEVDISD